MLNQNYNAPQTLEDDDWPELPFPRTSSVFSMSDKETAQLLLVKKIGSGNKTIEDTHVTINLELAAGLFGDRVMINVQFHSEMMGAEKREFEVFDNLIYCITDATGRMASMALWMLGCYYVNLLLAESCHIPFEHQFVRSIPTPRSTAKSLSAARRHLLSMEVNSAIQEIQQACESRIVATLLAQLACSKMDKSEYWLNVYREYSE
jgi:hypothetical protein